MEDYESGVYIFLVVVIAILCLSVFMNVGLWGQVKLQKNTIGVMKVELQSTRNIAILRTQEATRATGQYNGLIGQIQAAQKAQQEVRRSVPPAPAPVPPAPAPVPSPAGKNETPKPDPGK